MSKEQVALWESWCCPVGRQALYWLEGETLSRLAAAEGGVEPIGGNVGGAWPWGASSGVEGGLVRADGALLYPVRGGIPVLLREEAVEVPEGLRSAVCEAIRLRNEAKTRSI